MVEELRDRDEQVLLRIFRQASNSDPPTASDVADTLSWADASGNSKLHYRLNKLENAGLVESWKDEDRAQRGQLAPKVVTTTDRGEEYVNTRGLEPSEEKPLHARVDQVASTVRAMASNYTTIKQRILELEDAGEERDERIDELRSDLRDLQVQMGTLKKRLDRIDDADEQDGGERSSSEVEISSSDINF